MALIHQWLMTKDEKDSIGNLSTTNSHGVTFDSVNGANFTGGNSLQFTKDLSNMSFSLVIFLKTKVLGSYYVFADNSINAGIQLWSNGNQIANYGGSQAYGSGYDLTNYPTNKFTPIIMTYDKTLKSLYLYRGNTLVGANDGGIINPQTISSQWAIGTYGTSNDAEGFNLNAYARDARIYSHALSSTERNTIVTNGAEGTKPIQYPQAIGGF